MRRHFLKLATAAALAVFTAGAAHAEDMKVGANIGNVPW